MRIGRLIGLATLGYSVYRAYQSYSRSSSSAMGTTRRSMMPLRRRGSL